MTATNDTAFIETSIGTSGRDVGGSISLSSNRLGASASGNVAGTQVALAATQITTAGSPAGAMTANWGGRFGQAIGDATAVNAQANEGGVVMARLADGGISAIFADQSGEGELVGLHSASVSLKDNVLRSQAAGNDAVTGVALTANTAPVSATVASMQSNSAAISGEISDSGVTLVAGRVLASSIALDGNVLASAAVANRADNQLLARIGNVRAADGGFQDNEGEGEGGEGNSANSNFGMAIAGLTVINTQSNAATIDSRNIAFDGLVRATIGNDGYLQNMNGTSIASAHVSVRATPPRPRALPTRRPTRCRCKRAHWERAPPAPLPR